MNRPIRVRSKASPAIHILVGSPQHGGCIDVAEQQVGGDGNRRQSNRSAARTADDGVRDWCVAC